MKKLILLLFIPLVSFGQNIGLEVGYGLAQARVNSVHTNGFEGAENHLITGLAGHNFSGINIAVVLNYPISESLKIETGLGYEIFNAKKTTIIAGAIDSYAGRNINSLWIPLNFNYYINNITGLHLIGGINYSYNINKSRKIPFQLADGNEDRLKASAISSLFGFGYDIDDNFTVGVRYSIQLSNSNNKSSPEGINNNLDWDGSKLKTNILGFYIKYFL